MLKQIIKYIESVFLFAAAVVFLIGGGIFLYINNEIIACLPVLVAVYSVAGLTALAGIILPYFLPRYKLKNQNIINLIIGIAAEVAGLMIIIFQLIIDYFQPLSVFAPPIICLAITLLVYGLGTLAGVIFRTDRVSAGITGLAIMLVFGSTALWAVAQDYGEFSASADNVIVYASGEAGYATFRIPSLALIDKDILTANTGETYDNNVIFAFAEGRRDNAKDFGRIDVVMKVSDDYGEEWSEMEIVIKCEDLLGSHGRVADPTPVYDSSSNELCLLFRAGTEESEYTMYVYFLKGVIGSGLDVQWDYENIVNVSEALGENFGPGPSKGLELPDGTLAFPTSCKGENRVIYTSDGITWTAGEYAGVGGEADIALINGSQMIMICRSGNMSTFPRDNHLRFAFSDDYGATWHQPVAPSTLRTPVVMSSVTCYEGDIYCAYADSYLTRANLSYAVSEDGGVNWTTKRLYSGASGYTASAVSDSGDYFILAEMGKVEYHEEIRLFRIAL